MSRRPGSLVGRLLVITSVMLVLALGLTGFSLDRGFRQSARGALEDRLEAHLYGLMGLVEVSADGTVRLPDNLAEPRLAAGDSGLYAAIWDARGEPLWRSPSALGRELAPAADPGAPGRVVFRHDRQRDVYRLALTVRWELAPGRQRLLTFTVAEAEARFASDLAAFRRALWGWLAASAGFLVAVHLVLLRVGLKPLLRLTAEVKAIESGTQERFAADYPREIRPLTANMNALLDQDRARLARYRDSLGDLAHSLKTPLAVLHGLQRELGPEPAGRLETQLQRMQEAVDYHLQRAAAAGRVPLSAAVEVASLAAELARSLDKVHHGKAVAWELNIDPGLRFRGDRGDLMEILGNLMDNAWKWCAGRVRVTATATAQGLRLGVADDGPGVDEAHWPRLGERGFRPRGEAPGHGIGLAVVASLAAEYGARLAFAESDLGGLEVTLELQA